MSRLQTILSLIRKTRDTYIFNVGTDHFVIMPLEKYESEFQYAGSGDNLSDLTENELMERINRDIALWRLNQVSSEDTAYLSESLTKNDPGEKEDDQYYLEPID